MCFESAFTRLSSRLEQEELLILLWGPGENNNRAFYELRLAIQERLRGIFKNAEIELGESPALRMKLESAVPGSKDWGLQDQQTWHLGVSDICVILDMGQGANEEIAYMNSFRRFAHKLYILTPESMKENSAFAQHIRIGLDQDVFPDIEAQNGLLIERIISRIKHVALVKLAL